MSDKKLRNACCVFCFAFSFLLALGALLLFCFMGSIVHDQIAGNLQLKPNTPAFENWLKPPVPVHMQFYMFTVKNPYSVEKLKARPQMEQRGPYTYREVQNKSDVVFHDNGTLSYRMAKSFVFVPEMSNGTEKDVICNVNLFLIAAAQMIKNLHINKLYKEAIDLALEIVVDHSLFSNHTVGELLWGYKLRSLTILKDALDKFKIPNDLPNEIGIYYGKNGTDDGVYTIYSGTLGYSNFSMIQLWKGLPTVPYWMTNYANMINGTDGTSFPPFVEKEDKFFIFSSDLCRSIYVKFDREDQIHGIDVYRFVVPGEVFANHTVNPANWGYCSGGHCLGAGVLNVSVCQKGQPVIMSQPHFYMAAPEYLFGVGGMHPSAALSQTFLDIEPHTGMVLQAAKKLQVNIYVEPVKVIASLKDISRMYVPFLWVNENAAADEAAANKFKNEVLHLINIANLLKYIVLVGALCFFLLMTIVTMYCVFRSHKTRHEDTSKIINS